MFASLFLIDGAAQAHEMKDGTRHKHWYSKSDPLIAWKHDRKRAEAYGWSWKRSRTGDLMNHPYYRDVHKNDDFPVFAETRYSFYRDFWGAGSGWTGKKYKRQSKRTTNMEWHDTFHKKGYTDCYWCEDASKARVWSRVVVDRDRFRPDWRSKWTYKGFKL